VLPRDDNVERSKRFFKIVEMKRTQEVEFKQPHEEVAYFSEKLTEEQPKMRLKLKVGDKEANKRVLDDYHKY
jgi:hypothetical protein